MLFPQEDAQLLKAWIVKRIEDTSDADSDVLAEYIIALLKADGSKESIRKLCEEEIPDFLTEDPKKFLDDVFYAIAHKSYAPGAPSIPTQPALATFPNETQNNNASNAADPSSVPNAPQASSASRKRGFHERRESDDANGREWQSPSGRGNKQARRGGRGGRQEDTRHRRPDAFGPMGPGPYPFPQFDPNNPMEGIMQMQAMGVPLPPGLLEQFGQGFRGGHNQGRPRRRCHDFDTKGYCSKGSTCRFDHGGASYIPPMRPQGNDYDPNDAFINAQKPPDPMSSGFITFDQPRGRGGGRHRGRGGRKGGGKASFSADGPVYDRSKSTIVIENIPEECFSEEQVREFFSQFGTIVEVSMQPYKHLAIVKFDSWKSANDAYKSPKVIFDNRFVKVFWYKDKGDSIPASKAMGGAAGSEFNDNSLEMEGVQQEPELDMEEFQRRQDEAQKHHQQREAQRTELEQKRQDLQKQQEQLIARHREEAERLRIKLMEKQNGGGGGGAKTAAAADSATSQTDMLRAQLARLEGEAKMYGIDPDAPPEEYGGGGGGYGGRGGRGRGGSRGRGHMNQRRGAFRGQDGRHAAYAQYSIDNRPKRIAITGADFTSSEKQEKLRHHLLNTGEFESVDTTPSVTHVSFNDRKTAEKFYYSLHGGDLPGVDARLDLTWVNGGGGGGSGGGGQQSAKPAAAAAPVNAGKGVPNGSNGAGADGDEDDVMGGNGDEEDGEIREVAQETSMMGRAQRQINMDYEVEDEDGWIG